MNRPEEPGADQLDGLLVTFLERIEDSGSSVDEVLADLCEAHPGQAQELRASVRALVDTGLLTPSTAGQEPALPEAVGDFVPERVLGRGGMAVVYLARQTSLERRVALKLLRPSELESASGRARFQREIAVIERLDHPGIVSVHSVGQARGIPYLAMEYVRGCSLSRALARLAQRDPAELTGLDLRAVIAAEVGPDAGDWDEAFFGGDWSTICLRIARCVAEALEHAHERGVLHRDIKPSNVMVTPGGRVVLLDFGLAALVGADRLTRSGTELGSLPYMAPEQLEQGVQSSDARTDVYQLGVTLAEMLTLRSPFLDRGGREQTRQRILEGRPIPLRRALPDLSVDAELVCHAAMELDPSRRYASAADLAADLANAQHGRPVHARPAGRLVHGARFLARHRSLAALVAVLLLVVTVGPGLFALREAQAKERVQEVNVSLEAARLRAEAANTGLELANTRVEQANSELLIAFEQALGAIELLTETAREELVDVPMASDARQAMFEAAVEFLQGLDPPAGAQERTRLVLARARLQLTQNLEMLGRHSEARAEAEALIELLEGEGPEEASLLSRAHIALAVQLTALGEGGGVALVLEQALVHAKTAEVPLLEARCGLQLAIALRRAGRVEEALELGSSSLELLGRLYDEGRRGQTLIGLYSAALGTAGMNHAGRRAYLEAAEYFERGVEVNREALAEAGESRLHREQLVVGLVNLVAARYFGDVDGEVTELLEEAREHSLSLVERFPLVPDYHRKYLGVLRNMIAMAGGRGEDVLAPLVEQLAVQETMAARFQITEDRWVIALVLENLAGAHADAGDHESALACIERSLALSQEALAAAPGAVNYVRSRQSMLRRRAETLAILGRHSQAVEALQVLDPQQDVVAHLSIACVLATSVGPERFDDAVEHLRAAIEAGAELEELRSTPLLAPLAGHSPFEALFGE